MEAVVLVENTPGRELEGEHGLSLWIRYGDTYLLLDTGQSGLFWENGKKLGVPFDKLAYSVLSHGHYDHSGGYGKLLDELPHLKVYGRYTADHRFYSLKAEGMRDIGIPEKILEDHGENFVFVKKDVMIQQGVWLIGHHGADLSERGEKTFLFKEKDGRYVPDDFVHEQSLVFEEKEGLVICNSCSHAGMDRIVEEVLDIFPGRKILAVLGGFHLKGKNSMDSMAYPEEEVVALGRHLLELGVEQVYTGHCTGNKAYEVLEGVLGDRLHHLTTGNKIFI